MSVPGEPEHSYNLSPNEWSALDTECASWEESEPIQGRKGKWSREFFGTVYVDPPEHTTDPRELSRADIENIVQQGKFTGKPFLWEHLNQLGLAGVVTKAHFNRDTNALYVWFTLDGKTRHGKAAYHHIKAQKTLGLSLSHFPGSKEINEVSLCMQGKRKKCWIVNASRSAEDSQPTMSGDGVPLLGPGQASITPMDSDRGIPKLNADAYTLNSVLNTISTVAEEEKRRQAANPVKSEAEIMKAQLESRFGEIEQQVKKITESEKKLQEELAQQKKLTEQYKSRLKTANKKKRTSADDMDEDDGVDGMDEDDEEENDDDEEEEVNTKPKSQTKTTSKPPTKADPRLEEVKAAMEKQTKEALNKLMRYVDPDKKTTAEFKKAKTELIRGMQAANDPILHAALKTIPQVPVQMSKSVGYVLGADKYCSSHGKMGCPKKPCQREYERLDTFKRRSAAARKGHKNKKQKDEDDDDDDEEDGGADDMEEDGEDEQPSNDRPTKKQNKNKKSASDANDTSKTGKPQESPLLQSLAQGLADLQKQVETITKPVASAVNTGATPLPATNETPVNASGSVAHANVLDTLFNSISGRVNGIVRRGTDGNLWLATA